MMAFLSYLATGIICLCIGCIVMAIICDRANKTETDRLQQEIHKNSVFYLDTVNKMEEQIKDKDNQLQLKQRVLDTQNEELQRLRRINKRLRGDNLTD